MTFFVCLLESPSSSSALLLNSSLIITGKQCNYQNWFSVYDTVWKELRASLLWLACKVEQKYKGLCLRGSVVLGPVHVVFCIWMLNKEFSYETLHSAVFLWMCGSAFWFYMLCWVFLIEILCRSSILEEMLYMYGRHLVTYQIHTCTCVRVHTMQAAPTEESWTLLVITDVNPQKKKKVWLLNLRAVAEIQRKFVMFCSILWHLRLKYQRDI